MLAKILSWLPTSAIKKIVGSLIRHGLTALAGFIAARELVAPEILENFIITGSEVLTAIVMFGVAFVMSMSEKMGKSK